MKSILRHKLRPHYNKHFVKFQLQQAFINPYAVYNFANVDGVFLAKSGKLRG
jgi:hypothetical protein